MLRSSVVGLLALVVGAAIGPAAPAAPAAQSPEDWRTGNLTANGNLSKKPSPNYWGGPMLSAPGGRRVRATGRTHLEDEIALESRRWWETPPDGPNTLDPRYRHASRYKPGSWILANLIDIVAKGGNFMPSIGPDAAGLFHPAAIEQLEYVGDWLRVNGEAIYATRPWKHYKEGESVRFTQSKDRKHVYATSLIWPVRELRLKLLKPREGSQIFLLGVPEPLAWRVDAEGALVVTIPDRLQPESSRPCRQAYVFKIEPAES